MEKYNASECIAEEFIEGTMINLFYDQEANKWKLHLKRVLDAMYHFFGINQCFQSCSVMFVSI